MGTRHQETHAFDPSLSAARDPPLDFNDGDPAHWISRPEPSVSINITSPTFCASYFGPWRALDARTPVTGDPRREPAMAAFAASLLSLIRATLHLEIAFRTCSGIFTPKTEPSTTWTRTRQ